MVAMQRAQFFRRAPRNRSDERGNVIVQVTLRSNGAQVKGNVTRAVTVKDQRVSVVFAAIERALFGAAK